MAVAPELGELLDLAKAIGLVKADGTLDPAWFGDPAGHTAQLLRSPVQREAFLRGLDALLGQEGDVELDEQGRSWVPVVVHGGVALHLVVETQGAVTLLGLGARLRTSAPVSVTEVLVPLVRVPAGSKVTIVPSTKDGRLQVRTEIALGGVPSAPGLTGLQGIAFEADVAADGTTPKLSVLLRGLQLPGDAVPHDLLLDGSGSASALGDQAVRVVVGLVQAAVASATGPLAELLALAGLTKDPAVPPLPVAGILAQGVAPWRGWLEQVVGTPAARDAWLSHLAALVAAATSAPGSSLAAGAAPSVTEPSAPGEPYRVTWTVAVGVTVAATIGIGATTAGAPKVELGVAGRAEGTGTPPAALELDAVLAGITLGPAPAVRALPRLDLLARLGPEPGTTGAGLFAVTTPDAPGVPGHPVSVRYLRAGFALDAGRRPVLVLAAHDVQVAAHHHAVLDLTNPQTLADLGTGALEDLAGTLLHALGPAEAPVRVLLGLTAPPGGAWPVALTTLPALLGGPVTAVAGYHERVLRTHRAGYPGLLAPLGALLLATATGGGDGGETSLQAVAGDGAALGPAGGAGTEEDPWRLPLADGVALAVWALDAELHVGVAVDRAVTDLGGGCPTVALALIAELARIRLAPLAGQALTRLEAHVRFGARGGVPLRLGDAGAALVAQTIGVGVRWSAGAPLRAALEAPGMVADVGGHQAPIALPAVASDGTFEAEPPWAALELLSGHLLRRTGLPWAARAVDLLGWLPDDGGPGTAGRLPLEDLATDPVRALRAWALGTALPELAAWVALLVAGPAGPGMRSGPAPGRGDAGSPRAVPLPAGQGAGLAAGAGAAPPARGARLLLWDRAGRGPELEAFRPGALIAWIGAPTGTSAPPSGEQLAAPLRAAAASGRLAANLADGRDALGAGLAALVARFTNGDGLVPATGAPPAGVTVHDLPGVAHPSLPGAVDLAALGAPAAAAVVVALGPFGPASWPGVAPERTLDLTAPGLPIEAFDVTGPATAPGPWAVRLPRRADAVAAPGEDGLERQAARLARVVDAVVARAAGGPVAVVGAGAAGHAAARVAATRPGITHLVTVGTAHEPLALDLLDAPAAGDALRLLDALLPEPDPARPEHPAVVLGRALLAPWRGLLRATDPLADLAPPPAAPAIPPSVAVHRVRGKVGATAASKAVAALVVRALQEAFEADPGPLREDGGGLGCGLALRLAPPTADRAVRVRADLALALPGPGTAPGAGRALRVRVDVDRAGGWLAGGPEPGRPAAAPRGPSLRRATVELDVPLGADDAAAPRARIVLHEGEALGVGRVRWDLTKDSGPLTAEARVLVGLLAGAFGPLPPAGPVRELVGVLAALGLTQPGTSGATDAPVALSVEGVQRLLLDPGALLAEAPAGPLAAALAALCGAPPPAPAAPARFTLAVDGLIATVDLTARTVRVETVASGVRLAAGAVARGTLDLAADGAVAGSLALALGGGLTLEAALPAAAVRLLVTDGGAPGGLPAAVALAPQPDAVGLRRLLAALAPAEVLWAGITFVRGLEQPGVDALVDPLLRAVRLLRPDGRLVVPTGFLADPGRWLARLLPAAPATSAPSALVAAATTTPTPDAIAAAWDALGALLGVPSARAGTWALPYGLELSAGTSGGRARLGVAVPTAPSGVGLRLTGTASLLVGRGLPPAPQGDLVLATPSAAGRLTLTAGAGGTTARLAVPSLGLDVGLVPLGAGLGGDAAQAVIHALPHVLDALAALPSSHPAGGVGATVGQLGECLGLRVEKTFRADQLAQLAAAPGPQLAQRLSANPTLGLAALRDLLAPAVPTSLSLTANATELRLARTDQTGKTAFAVALSVPSTAGVQVTGALAGRTPFPGATLDAEVSVGAAGLALAHVLLGVKPAAPLRLGPLAVAPRIDLAVGTAAQDGQHLAVGLAVPDAAVSGVLRPGPPRTFGVEATGRPLAEAVTAVLLPLALDLALSTAAMGQLLARPVLGTTVKTLLDGVVFAGDAVAPGALRPAEAFDRLLRLGTNIAKAPKAPKLEVAPLTVAAHAATDSAGAQLLGLTVSLPPGERLALVKGDVTVQAEVDASWVGTTGGLTVDVVRIPKGGKPEPALLVALAGFGLRVGRPGGPLLDGFVVADSVAAHGLLEVGGSGVTAAGGQLELAGLRLPVGSATGGGNRLAQGIMRDSAAGTEPLAPKFSPALAVTRRAGKLSVDLRAGEGAGPWFLPIQRGFGPVYVEQIGFGVTRSADRVSAARVLVDGRVSLLGLTVAVDDLALQAPWPQDGGGPDVTQPGTWEIGLAGLAVSAESSGLSLSGGLRRVSSTLPNYEGMISLRFGPYGLTAYGGYAVLLDEQGHDFTSLFIFGALNAPLGGPPAFFVTGIGAGVGLNRLLRMPPTLADLPDHPLVAALNPSSGLAKDPMAALVKLDKYFPAERGAFWFAAGVSFTSFALVDAVAVLGVAVADGLELSLLGLARAALPTPAAPLAQLELALLARFSTREGILWVQAQLTDNSWLLSRDVRLTGGFAFVSWFKGDKAGEFVLTVGGYHPSFHRDGYPVVPRVGFRWAVGKALVVKGETYFALTSEAIMAGARLEASLTLGPLWASLRVGADGIVFFDPFRFEVTAFAELGAGITVDVDLGIFGHLRFTIGFHLHADVLLAGPNFHGTATIDLGVTSATIAFGEISGPPALPLVWDDFLGKYLQPAGARVLTAVPGRGQLPQPTTSSKTPPTGEPGDPFLVQPEFGLEITTTAATTKLAIGTAPPVAVAGADPLAIGPMQEAVVTSTLGVSIIGSTGEQAQAFGRTPVLGRFPKGVWGPQADDAPLPKGETLGAATGVRLDAAVSRGPGVSPVEYHQVEIGPRLPNPLLAALNLIVGPAPPPAVAGATPAEAFALAERRLREGALGRPPTPTALALLRTRLAPPQLVPLTAGLGAEPLPHVDVVATRTLAGDGDRHRDGHAPPPAPSATAPTGRAVLRLAVAPGARPRPRTTAGAHGEGLPRVAPPGAGTVAAVRERHDPRLPLMLELREPLRLRPAFAGPGEELRRGVGVGAEAAAQLRAAGAALADGGLDVAGGEVVVLDLPGAERDDDERRRPRLHVEGATRVVALDTVGGVVLDATPARGEVALPLRTARLALVGGGGRSGAAIGWASGTWLVQVGGRVLVGPGCTVQTTALATRRRRVAVSTAFVRAARAVDGLSVVTTRLPADVRTVAVQHATHPGGGDILLELGIAGADLEGEPLRVTDGDLVTEVHRVRPEPGARDVAVTVASGADVGLGGVLGSALDAEELAGLVAEQGLAALLGDLVPDPEAHGTVRLDVPHVAPAAGPPRR